MRSFTDWSRKYQRIKPLVSVTTWGHVSNLVCAVLLFTEDANKGKERKCEEAEAAHLVKWFIQKVI